MAPSSHHHRTRAEYSYLHIAPAPAQSVRYATLPDPCTLTLRATHEMPFQTFSIIESKSSIKNARDYPASQSEQEIVQARRPKVGDAWITVVQAVRTRRSGLGIGGSHVAVGPRVNKGHVEDVEAVREGL